MNYIKMRSIYKMNTKNTKTKLINEEKIQKKTNMKKLHVFSNPILNFKLDF